MVETEDMPAALTPATGEGVVVSITRTNKAPDSVGWEEKTSIWATSHQKNATAEAEAEIASSSRRPDVSVRVIRN